MIAAMTRPADETANPERMMADPGAKKRFVQHQMRISALAVVVLALVFTVDLAIWQGIAIVAVGMAVSWAYALLPMHRHDRVRR